MSPRFEDAASSFDAVLALYEAVGWTGYTRDPERLRRAIEGSAFVTCAYEGERLVGFARAISDGGTAWFLIDLLIAPDRQRAGLGAALLSRCERRFADVSRGVLLTDDAVAPFYDRLGWERARERGVVTCWINRSTPHG